MPNGVRFEGQTMSLHRPSTDQKKRRSRLETWNFQENSYMVRWGARARFTTQMGRFKSQVVWPDFKVYFCANQTESGHSVSGQWNENPAINSQASSSDLMVGGSSSNTNRNVEETTKKGQSDQSVQKVKVFYDLVTLEKGSKKKKTAKKKKNNKNSESGLSNGFGIFSAVGNMWSQWFGSEDEWKRL